MRLAESICYYLTIWFERFERRVPIYSRRLPQKRNYDDNFSFELSGAAGVIDLFKPFLNLQGKHVLDVGCGFGGKSIFYIRQGAYVTGIDILRHRILYAQDLIKKYNDSENLRFILADAHKLPFKERTFDIVISTDFMEHAYNPFMALQELFRVVKIGGLLCISFGPLWLSPGGGHIPLSFPWIHLIFSERTLRNVLIRQKKRKEKNHDDPLYETLNKITVKDFKKIVYAILTKSEHKILKFQLWSKWFLKPLLLLLGVREFFCARINVLIVKGQNCVNNMK